MSDESIAAQIDRLVGEEKELRRRQQVDRDDDQSLEADRDRLRAVEVELDRCWDLLRQRRLWRSSTRTPTKPRRAGPARSRTTSSNQP